MTKQMFYNHFCVHYFGQILYIQPIFVFSFIMNFTGMGLNVPSIHSPPDICKESYNMLFHLFQFRGICVTIVI